MPMEGYNEGKNGEIAEERGSTPVDTRGCFIFDTTSYRDKNEVVRLQG